MNGCGYQKKSSEERSVLMETISMFCPKSRKLGHLNPSLNDHLRPLRFPFSHPTDMGDPKAGAELVDLTLAKGYGGERSNCAAVASLPPFNVR